MLPFNFMVKKSLCVFFFLTVEFVLLRFNCKILKIPPGNSILGESLWVFWLCLIWMVSYFLLRAPACSHLPGLYLPGAVFFLLTKACACEINLRPDDWHPESLVDRSWGCQNLPFPSPSMLSSWTVCLRPACYLCSRTFISFYCQLVDLALKWTNLLFPWFRISDFYPFRILLRNTQ